MKKFIKKYTDDIIIVTGLACIAAAGFFYSVFIGLIVAGIELIAAGLLYGYSNFGGK